MEKQQVLHFALCFRLFFSLVRILHSIATDWERDAVFCWVTEYYRKRNRKHTTTKQKHHWSIETRCRTIQMIIIIIYRTEWRTILELEKSLLFIHTNTYSSRQNCRMWISFWLRFWSKTRPILPLPLDRREKVCEFDKVIERDKEKLWKYRPSYQQYHNIRFVEVWKESKRVTSKCLPHRDKWFYRPPFSGQLNAQRYYLLHSFNTRTVTLPCQSRESRNVFYKNQYANEVKWSRVAEHIRRNF